MTCLGTRAVFGKEPKVLKTNFYDPVDILKEYGQEGRAHMNIQFQR